VGVEGQRGSDDDEEEDDEGSEEEEKEDSKEKGAEDDEGGEEGTWDAALHGDRMGTRVFVDEGTAPDVSGRCATPFFAVTSSHRTGCS
jgi:hypothetical protein